MKKLRVGPGIIGGLANEVCVKVKGRLFSIPVFVVCNFPLAVYSDLSMEESNDWMDSVTQFLRTGVMKKQGGKRLVHNRLDREKGKDRLDVQTGNW